MRLHYPDDIEQFIPAREWALYSRVLHAARARGLRFAMSGGFTISFYTGMWRNTKDMDLCVLPQDRDAMVEATREAGLHDLFDEKPYDRGWIYRATAEGVIVDTIWQQANYRAQVDEQWLAGPEVTIHGERLALISPEATIFSKLYIVQRDRCDWPDILNMLYSVGAGLDWDALISRCGPDVRVLASVVLLFSWLAPGRAREFPEQLWQRLGVAPPEDGPVRDDARVRFIDSRPWFCPT